MSSFILVTTSDGINHRIPLVEGNPDFSGIASPNTRRALEQAIAAGHWEPYTPEPEPMPTVPNWDGFNAQAMTDPRLNQVMGAVLGLAPAIALGLPAALAQVSQNGPEAFALVFGALCQLGGATEGDRAAWAQLAEANNLPADFVAIVRGDDG